MYRILLSTFLILFFSVAFSQEAAISEEQKELTIEFDTVKNKKGGIIPEILIIRHPERPVTIGKSPIKPMDLPQATAVIRNETIEQQQILRLSDALKNTNGVYVSGASNASGNNQEEIGARGFTFSGGNTFKNGVRFNSSLIPEVSSLESIEILKGNTALLFGNVGPGGILNLVTKKPQFRQGGEVSFRWGEFDQIKPTIDVYGNINNSNQLAYRVITSYEKGNSYRDVVESERFYINPSFLFNVSKKTTLLVEGDYLKDTRTPDFGLAAINYEVVELPRNSFLGFDWGHFKSSQESFTSTLSHQLSDKWEIKGVYSYQGYKTNLLSSLRPNATNLVQPNGDWRRGVQKTDAKQDYSIAQVDLTGKFNTGKIKHTFLLGSDADRSNTITLAYKNITHFDSINIYNPRVSYGRNPDFEFTQIPELERNTNADANIKRGGLYLQDLLEFSPKIKMLAGLRYSYLESTTNTFSYSTNENVETKTHENIISPKMGMVFQPTLNHSLFANYSNSFALNTGTDRNLQALPASMIHQYEVGVKNIFLNGHLHANLTGYIIDYSNLAQTDFADGNTNTNIKELAGAYQSKGLEFDVTGIYNNVRLMAGYSFNEAKYTESNIYEIGTPLRFTPKHTANASAFYTFNSKTLNGLELGLISTYIGERFGGRLHPLNATTNAELARRLIPVGGFFQFDASIGYTFRALSLRAKLSNLANVVSYYVYDDNTVTPIAPRMLSATVSYKF